MRIAEGFVPGEFCFRRRNQLIPLLYIMDISNGKPASILKIRRYDLPVRMNPTFFQTGPQSLRLQRIMPPQGGIAAGNQQERLFLFL